MKAIIITALGSLLLISCEQNKKNTNLTSEAATYKIAYNIHVPDTAKDDWEIMIMNMDGSDKKNITNDPDVAWTYHAFRDRLFFISDRDTLYRHYFLYEMDAQGQNVKKVSNLRLEDSWMSSRNEGRELVVAGRIAKEIRHQLFIIDTKTGNYHQITSDTVAYYHDPCFSPDGLSIAFTYKANKRDRNTFEEIYIMKADGTEMRQLTHYPENNPSASDYGYKAGATKWHPTENFISYISKQDGRHSIFAVSPDGNQQWKLTSNDFAEGWHDWSPDGNWLAFNSSDDEEMQYHIMLMNWQSKVLNQLTDSTYKSQQAPVFVEQ